MDIGGIWVTHKDIAAICELTGTHRTTVARWLERREFPVPVARLLALIYNGDLGAIHDDWQGFKIDPVHGRMANPSGRAADAGEVMSIRYRYQMIATLQHELRVLRERKVAARNAPDNVVQFPTG